MVLEKAFEENGKTKIGDPMEITYLCMQQMDEMKMANSLSNAIEEKSPKNAKFYKEVEGSRRSSSPLSNFVDLEVQYFY